MIYWVGKITQFLWCHKENKCKNAHLPLCCAQNGTFVQFICVKYPVTFLAYGNNIVFLRIE